MGDRLYFAYGSNINLDQMAVRCPAAQVVGPVVLDGYELLFRGGRMGAVATVEPKEGSSVPVLLWKIREQDEAALDRYEGYPGFYGKQMMEVDLNGKKVSAMVYVMTPGYEFGVPSDRYADTILKGYEEAGFDLQILEDAIDHAYELVAEVEGQAGMKSRFGMGGFDTLH